MRRVTRIVLGCILAGTVLLLALGALPSYLGSGAPHYLVATPVDDGPALDVADLPERRYPYLFGALEAADGWSDPYYRGPYGLKESFTHSPFDEFDALRGMAPANATQKDTVYVSYQDQRYRMEVVSNGQ